MHTVDSYKWNFCEQFSLILLIHTGVDSKSAISICTYCLWKILDTGNARASSSRRDLYRIEHVIVFMYVRGELFMRHCVRLVILHFSGKLLKTLQLTDEGSDPEAGRLAPLPWPRMNRSSPEFIASDLMVVAYVH